MKSDLSLTHRKAHCKLHFVDQAGRPLVNKKTP